MASKKEPRKSAAVNEHFKPALAQDIEFQFFKTDERGNFYLARNPRGQRYVKVHESTKELMEKMDGTTPLVELDQTIDIDAYTFVDFLAKRGFLANVESEKKKEPFYTIKIPLFKSNKPIFTKMYTFFSFVASKPFMVFYILFVGISIFFFVIHSPEMFRSVVMSFDLTVPLTPLLLLFVIAMGVELIHEFAHTGASYNYGAEPGDIGLVFHFLVVFFYVETPDTRVLSTKGNINTFIAGPLASLFAAAVCTYIFVFTDYYPVVWGASAFLWNLSTLITLSPFMQTDGYYIVQHLLKFPNLFGHAVSYLRLNIFHLCGYYKKEEYQKKINGYTPQEKKIMKVFALFIPVQVGILVYFFFFMGLKINMFHVLELAPVILSGSHPYGIKAYFLLFAYSLGIIMGVSAAATTAYKFFKEGKW